MIIKKILDEVFEEILNEWNKPESKKKVQENIIDPIVSYCVDRVYFYFIIGSIISFILIFLVILILILLLTRTTRTPGTYTHIGTC